MVQVGADSTDMPIHGYVGWPIFREFRTTNQFSDTFKRIFGVEFVDEMTREVESAPGTPQLEE